MSGREFRDDRNLVVRLLDWAAEQLARFVGALTTGGPGAVMAWLVLLSLVAALTYLAFRLVTTRRSVVRGASRLGPIELITSDTEPGRSPAEWRDEAERCLTRGDHRRAVRARYRAVVGELVARGWLDDVPGRTEGEYRAEMRTRHPGAASPFDELTELFERVWFGDEPAGSDTWERVGSLEADLDRAAKMVPA